MGESHDEEAEKNEADDLQKEKLWIRPPFCGSGVRVEWSGDSAVTSTV